MIKFIYFLSFFLIAYSYSKQAKLAEPVFQTFDDQLQTVSLAQNQKFTLPITTRTITYSIQTVPENSNQCQFHFQSLIYKSLASNSLSISSDITDFIPLERKSKVFLIDQNHNLMCYSLDDHILLKKLNPKTNVIGPSKQQNQRVDSVVLASTQNQDVIFYMTPEKYYAFSTDSFGLQKLFESNLQGGLKDIQKAITYQNYIFVLSKGSGIFIYQVNKYSKKLTLFQKVIEQGDYSLIDMQFSVKNQLLYILYFDLGIIDVYRFNPSQFPQTDKSFTIFKKYDEINIGRITNTKSQTAQKQNFHLDIAISTDRQEQTIMVLFNHNYQSIIAEIFYEHVTQSWKFVRYFKFNIVVSEIHIVDDNVLIVGDDTIGVFPIGIHPRLIDQQMNGIMRLSSIFRLKSFEGGKFVGITKNTIEYGVIKSEERSYLNCKINQQSQIKTLKLTANLTACKNQDRVLYEKYCMYQKIFQFEQIKLTVSAPIARSIGMGLLILILAIVLCVFIILGMKKKKEREIRKLQMFFMQQQKKKQQAPQSERKAMGYF